MPTVPYFLQLSITLGGNGTGTITYTVPRNETLSLRQIRYNSTSTFNITDIRDSTGRNYTNASSSNAIPSAVIQDGGSNTIGIQEMQPDLVIEGAGTFYIDLADTSGANNTVQVTLVGTREFP